MAKKTRVKSKRKSSPPKKKAAAAKRAPANRRPAKRAAAKARSSAPKQGPTQDLYGWITHTELASADPDATKAWCAKVLGWAFQPSFPMPGGGDYHTFAYSERGGGGIRLHNPPEVPGSIPYIHVADANAAYENALREGAEEMLPPTPIMDGVTIAIVRAPGAVAIGFSGP
jgi:uncharacterized protein